MDAHRHKALGQSRLVVLQQQLAQLRLAGFADAAMEREYLVWVRLESAPMRRVMMAVPLLAMLLAPLYGGLLHTPAAANIAWLRLIEFAIAGLCAASIMVLWRQPQARASTYLMYVTSLAVFWAVSAIRWLVAPGGSSLSPEIVMVVPLALAAVGRLRLWLSLPMALGCPALFLLLEWQLGHVERFASTVLGTLLFSGLSVITAIATDRLLRRAWLSRGIVELTAMSDAVTALPNRQWFNRDFSALFAFARRNREPLAVFLLDLDHFKKLNDSHGHAAGDAALAQVGTLLTRYSRRAMDMSGRYGGEEFVLVLHNPTFNGVQRIAGQLLADITALGIDNAGAPLKTLTASIGIYMAVPSVDDRPEDFLRQADNALYVAKQAGRNRYRFARPEDAVAPALDPAEQEPIPIT